MEQLASKTMEIDSFILKPIPTDVSTPSSHFSSYLHHSTSNNIILLHQFTKERRKSQTASKLGEILNKQEKLANFSAMCSAIDPMRNASPRPILEGLPTSKSGEE